MLYRKKHVRSKIHKIKHPKGSKSSIFKKTWFWITILFLIIVLSTFYFFLFYPGIQVKNIIISGNQKVLSKDIESLVASSINSKILDVAGIEVDSRSIFLVNFGKLNKEILDKFPIIESVKISRKFPQTLNVAVSERAAAGIFCPSTSSGQAGKGQCFMIDQAGIIFEKASLEQLNSNYIVVSQNLSDKEISIGQNAVDKNIIDIILKIQKDLKDNYKIDIQTATIASSSRLNVSTAENWQIYFGLDASPDIDSQITELNLLLSGGISANQRNNLRYIDLRPMGKAIVCDNMECGSPH